MSEFALDLADIDADSVSWQGGVQGEDLYGIAPAGSITLAEGANAGRTCGGCIGCGCSRPISWCCAGCH
ncbi:hypothetical protein [Micromonospora sp. NPDC047074]|uniref:hypothetical protein n=1 Tax=Micromonospora sp. NPDC047074 TaxID=3154339 RepID=UPI0033E53A64